eukprot:TRINITY_DN11561_c0_g1_i2.p1 TRINITY_DN11561_c0_g1~~TRINITY_DN11561_c0_g1_i2.p1  ORF type:complete len:221 (+),score=-19.33 TRINITY_DN11561_c0_g1_i2:213-875(+)
MHDKQGFILRYLFILFYHNYGQHYQYPIQKTSSAQSSQSSQIQPNVLFTEIFIIQVTLFQLNKNILVIVLRQITLKIEKILQTHIKKRARLDNLATSLFAKIRYVQTKCAQSKNSSNDFFQIIIQNQINTVITKSKYKSYSNIQNNNNYQCIIPGYQPKISTSNRSSSQNERTDYLNLFSTESFSSHFYCFNIIIGYQFTQNDDNQIQFVGTKTPACSHQ